MMKDLMKEVTHTRWAKVELTCTGENRFDVVFHTRRVPFGNRSNEFHAGDFRIEKWNLTSREVYSLIRHYFSTLANNGYEKLTDKVMRAIVDLRQTYFLTVENRMDHIHQQANEENTMRKEEASTMTKIYSGYRVFDEFMTDRNKALKVLEGWEHKEKLTECHVLVHCDDARFIEEDGRFNIDYALHYSTSLQDVLEAEEDHNE